MFSYPGIIVRWLMSMFVVFAIFNPSGYSYVHWVLTPSNEPWSLKILVGMVLASIMTTFGRSVARSLGRAGVLATSGLFIAATWTLVDLGVLRDLTNGTYVTIALVIVASILAVGLSWSHVTMRVTGQVDSNDVTLR
jgi:hypothetical protein